MKQKEQILLWILWNGQTDCPLTFLNAIYVKYLVMALRHSDAAMLIGLPFIYINWFDIWIHISYNCAFKKKSVNIIFIGCNGILCISHTISTDEGWMSELTKNFQGKIFFLWKEVIPVKYKLLFFEEYTF